MEVRSNPDKLILRDDLVRKAFFLFALEIATIEHYQ
jgi:hypothetical protein